MKNLASGQTESFSIHRIAEQQDIDFQGIKDKYDTLEKEMLDEFFSFLSSHVNFEWLHWNMRDSNYGFQAIAHRYKVLHGKPILIEESRKHDLARYLVALFGLNYMSHPRLPNLTNHNDISMIDFLTGEEEAQAFEDRQYVALHLSTLRKVDIIAGIFQRVIDGRLKTYSRWLDVYGYKPDEIAEYLRDNWIVFVVFLVGSLASIIALILT